MIVIRTLVIFFLQCKHSGKSIFSDLKENKMTSTVYTVLILDPSQMSPENNLYRIYIYSVQMFVLKVYLSINEMRWTVSVKNRKTDNTINVRVLLSILYDKDLITGWRLQRVLEGSIHKPSHRQQPNLYCNTTILTITEQWITQKQSRQN